MRDEAALVGLALAGDGEAFDLLLAPYTQRAYRTACLITHDADLAAEALQDGLLRAYRALGNLREGSPFSPWFSRIVVNEAIKLAKRRSRHRWLFGLRPDTGWPEFLAAPPPDTPEAALQVREERRALWLAIEQLSPVHRAVIVLRYFEELSEPEIAGVLQIPPGTVKSRLHNARAALERRLRQPDLSGLLRPISLGGESHD